MAQAPINDNINITAPKATDDRFGVWQAGVFRAFVNFSEGDAKLIGRKYPNMVVAFRTEVSSGVFQDVDYRWDGAQWIVFDAKIAEGKADTADAKAIVAQEDADAAFTEASNKIPLAQKDAVGGVPDIDTVFLKSTYADIRNLFGSLKTKYFKTTDIEGDWVYDPTDTTTVDDGGTTLVTSDGKRIKRYLSGFIDVSFFNAIGNGAANDYTPLLNAINASSLYKLPLHIEKTYNINSNNLILPVNTVLDFKNKGSIVNGSVTYNETTKILNADNIVILGRDIHKLSYVKSNWIDWSQAIFGDGIIGRNLTIELTGNINFTFNITLRLPDSKISHLNIIGNGYTLSTSSSLQLISPNLTIENTFILLNTGGVLRMNNFGVSTSKVKITGGSLKNISGYKQEMGYGMAYTTPPGEINSNYDVYFKDVFFDNIPIFLSNAGYITIDNCISIQGDNNEVNHEQLHIANPILKKGLIKNSKFFVNGFASDCIDLYTCSNVTFDSNYFEGSFVSTPDNEATFINTKSQGEQVTPAPSDSVRASSIKIINNVFKLMGFGYHLRIGNFVRGNESVPILDKYKRVDINIFNNSFIFDGVVNPRGCIFSVGSSIQTDISHNSVYIKNAVTGSLNYYFLATADSSATGDNTNDTIILAFNKLYVDSESIPVNFTFLSLDNTLSNAKIIGNEFSLAAITRNRLINPVMFGNSFDPLSKGTTAQRPSGLVLSGLDYYVGLLYFDTTLGRYIYWSGTSWITELKGNIKSLGVTTPLSISDYGSNGELTIFITASMNMDITLLSANASIGLTTNFIRLDNTTFVVRVIGLSGQLIETSNMDSTLIGQYSSYTLQSNGTSFFKVNKTAPFISNASLTNQSQGSLNTNYPYPKYNISTIVSFYNLGLEYRRISETQWTFTPTNLLS